MKKLIAFITVALMFACLMAVPSNAAESLYLSEQTIPYATTAPTLDGVLTDWANAAKFVGNADNMLPVACAAVQTGFVANVYMMWDETYFYVASEVTDTNNGRLVYGKDGDFLRIMYDFDGILVGLQNAFDRQEVSIPDITGILNMSYFNTFSFPVTAASGDNKAIGFQTRYGEQPYEVHDPNPENPDLLGEEASCSSNGNTWIIEQKIKWTDLAAIFDTVYGSFNLQFPTIGAGTVVTFMTSYNDCNETNAWQGMYIGQNKLTPNPQATPNCYGFKGTLGAKPTAVNPDTPENPDTPTPPAPDTADFSLTVALVVVSAAAIAIGAKKRFDRKS